MHRLVLTSAAAAVAVLLVAGPAHAFQCPKLVGQITAAAGNRFDAASNGAKEKAAAAQKLHAEGKHAEAEKIAKEGLTQLGVKM